MSHTHEEGQSSYYLEQLCTITLCGALSGVAIMMWARGSLFFLIDRFQWFVFFGGIALLVLVVIRAVSVWYAVGQKTAVHVHDHAHEPGHDCAAHDHAGHDCAAHDHAHDHDHSHEHGPTDGPGHDHAWNPWRYAVLLLPIVLYFMNLPNQGFMGERKFRGGDFGAIVRETVKNYSPDTGIQFAEAPVDGLPMVMKVHQDTPAAERIQAGDLVAHISSDTDADGKTLEKPAVVATKGWALDKVLEQLQGKPETKVKLTILRPGYGKPFEVELTRKDVIVLEFRELERARFSPEARDYFSGRIGKIRGQFAPSNKDKLFSLYRLKMTCCAADVIPLNVIIEVPESMREYQPADWIEVEGQIQFAKPENRNDYIPSLKVSAMNGIRKIPPERNVFVQW